MNTDWNDFRVFLAIARSGTLSEAARLLGSSQPTVGRRLQALEQTLGHALFQRTTDGYVLSNEGEAILCDIERMEEQATAVERKLAGGFSLDGLVRVSTTEWFGVHVLAPIFANVRIHHPNLSIELITETRSVSLTRREADISFRFKEFDEPDVIQTRAIAIEFSAYASRAYLRRNGHPGAGQGPGGTTSEGHGHTLVTMDTGFGNLADVPWLLSRLPEAVVGLRANSRDVQARLCAAGAGIAVLPHQVGATDPGLVMLDLGELPPGRIVWAGVHKDMRRSPRIRALLSATLDALAAQQLATVPIASMP
ncbi:LysR family transcriptional regulator [Massilia dura]|uniref:LysR family transcriptional regulator n=1 Tax=Pseudoduganella dura TaxID=321982 RepID=A0A6I3XEV4_9BURK|nr:LysR family transcriptional regulator [Pseudoduganella dura]MUI14116.1 LysR family transcriptional regulator [Pseudoduganella dura]